jgi:uncharacterized protein (UPF0297 family)
VEKNTSPAVGYNITSRAVFSTYLPRNEKAHKYASKIDRHRMVNQTLKEEYLSDLHSVTIRALTVEEFT